MMLSFYWTVHFADGTVLSQFHPETGEEIPFRMVERVSKPIIKAGWYPFPLDLRMKLANRGIVTRGLPSIAGQEVDLSDGAELILKRQGRLKLRVRGDGHPVQETYYIIGKKRDRNVWVYVLDSDGHRVQPGVI